MRIFLNHRGEPIDGIAVTATEPYPRPLYGGEQWVAEMNGSYRAIFEQHRAARIMQIFRTAIEQTLKEDAA